MSDFTYSIVDDSTTPAEVVDSDLSQGEAVEILLTREVPSYHFHVNCWDESVTEEDGAPPIEWQKGGDEFLRDVFIVGVDPTGSPPQRLLDAADEAVHCLEFLTPIGAALQNYRDAVLARLRLAIEELEGAAIQNEQDGS